MASDSKLDQFAGVENTVRIEQLFDLSHQPDFRVAATEGQKFLFQQPYAMLRGD